MDNTFVTLWQASDPSGNMQARARMAVGQAVYDETIAVPVSLTTDGDLTAAINARMAELAAGVTDPSQSRVVNPASVEQIMMPRSEVNL